MKKALSLLLSLIMVFSLVPVAAFADGEPTISFETTFVDGMAAGDTFSVTASLANNPGIATLTLSLKWNEDAVKFNGFETEYDEDEEADVLASDVYGAMATVVNNELGILVGSRVQGTNTKKNGTLFTANFEIIGSGELEIGLKDADRTEFEMVNAAMEVIEPVIDYAAIANLAVAGAEPEGPAMPAGAPFTAVTTDAGAAIAIERQDDVGDVPYYIITIPEDATTAYVTAPDQAVMEDWTTGKMQATAYVAEVESGWNQLYISFDYETTADGPKVEIPMNMTASDFSGGETELCFVEDEYGDLTHAFGIEDANYACLGYISFRYGRPGGEDAPTTYKINIAENITGGTVTVLDENMMEITEAEAGDFIFLANAPEEGYQFKHYLINGVAVTEAELGMNNGFYQMPGEAITVSAVFEANHTCVYDQSVVDTEYLKSEATCQSGAGYYKSCTCGEFATTAETFVSGDPVGCVYVNGACKWCGAAEPVQTPGYRFATSADVSAENGGNAVVHVKITGHSDPTITTYNAYDLTLTYDNTRLEFVSGEGADSGDQIKIEKKGENQIQIVGVGDAKTFDVEVAKLTFKTLAEGAANITIDKVQISDNDDAVNKDIPDATPKHDENDTTADETPDESVIVVPFSVTKPDFISGNDTALVGKDYTFSFTDTDNYTHSELKVTVGGTEVTPTEENGVYTIENVTGAIVITATQTAKSYAVTLPESAQGPEQATYGEKYTFTVTPDDGYAIASVKAFIGEKEIAVTVEDGKYVIAGGDITGAIKIVVEQTKIEVPETKYTKVTFEGITAEEIEDGLIQNPESGKPFTFKLNKIEGYNYVVKIGETELTANEDGTYTIAGELLVADGELTVVIVKTEIINVEVTQYIELDEQAMFLVTAKSAATDSVLKYGEEAMYRSSKYEAYSWLVISTDSAEAVKAAAESAITIAEAGTTAPAVAYGFDVNGTSKVDVNDAQLVYDMYNASYDAFTENLTVKKFLEADVDGSKNLGTQDVAAIINYIVNGNNA